MGGGELRDVVEGGLYGVLLAIETAQYRKTAFRDSDHRAMSSGTSEPALSQRETRGARAGCGARYERYPSSFLAQTDRQADTPKGRERLGKRYHIPGI